MNLGIISLPPAGGYMTKPKRPLRVFISHSSKDLPIARELYLRLTAEGWMDLWFIKSNLQIDQNWDFEIRKAVESADVVIFLLSKHSTRTEVYFYPDAGFVFDILQSTSKKKVLIIPLRLDSSNIPANLKIWEATDYLPKSQRKLGYSQMLERLRLYAKQHGFSMDKRPQDSVSEQGLQWSPMIWKKLADGFGEDLIDSESHEQKPMHPPSKLKKRIFSGANNLFFATLTICVLAVVITGILTVNYLVRGRAVNPITIPVISRVLTLFPVPTPTLGVGSARVSPIDGMRMVYIPEGKFNMGSDSYQDDEKPVHSVYLDAFWIDQYEVTNGMYAKCIEAKKCTVPIPYLFGVPIFDSNQKEWRYLPDKSKFFDELAADPEFFNQPVIHIRWESANAYCRWAGRRLPTEAEWEKAARGVDKRTYPWGEKFDCTRANFSSCVGNPSRVGSYEAGQSPYGAYDMAGNAMEWVADWYGDTYYQNSPSENPLGPASGLYRVFRGGSWGSDDFASRSANRPGNIANIPDDFIGFRCALSE